MPELPPSQSNLAWVKTFALVDFDEQKDLLMAHLQTNLAYDYFLAEDEAIESIWREDMSRLYPPSLLIE